ncbi:preprotein translocase subunit SecE [Pigmentiphaga aceris]|uniref:Protein translocase subunit SecE n=1 Tax=Pigmentiphaga aceris TaxID=1940612 RepID=A0A5C0B710_9BURK|nr:preprotein translocase subunit SecE [Pigmentiphaga aceris]QEI08791.1 preprotein translocase subunit SecE [Pigmentiphaga aceris]
MSNPNVETVTSASDRVKVGLALACVVAGIAGYYALPTSPTIARVGVIFLGLALAIAIAMFSEPGRRFISFGRDAYSETRKVVWPTRKETVTTTAAVFAFAVIMALFLWITDKSIEWVLYDLILGWK